MFATRKGQGTPTHIKKTLVANASQQIIDKSAWHNGARILNWTASPVYLMPGISGDPALGAPSDFVPAAAGGVPGQYDCPYGAVDGMRAIGAAAGDLTVIIF